MIHFLTFKSLYNRKFTTMLCILSVALSVTLFLSIERIRTQAKDGFTNTISKTDLIVGAKGGQLQLLLYTVFHLGNAVNNIRMQSFEDISKNPYVEWAIPISLGDSYKGFRVIATNDSFFKNYRFRGDNSISLKVGRIPDDTFDVVLGSDVAKKSGLKVNDPIVLSHGISNDSIFEHNKTPFKIVGIINPTQTPIDTAIYINLYGMEAMHFGWETGVPNDDEISPERFKKENIQINQITSFLVKLKSRIAILNIRRLIDSYDKEPLMGIIPALALSEMWQTIGYVEQILFLVSICILIVGVLSILISLYTSVNERRREMAILRSLGASSFHIFALMLYESSLLVLFGEILGTGILYLILLTLRPWLQSNFSVYIELGPITSNEWLFLAFIFFAGCVVGIIPAIKAYFFSLQDGLTTRF
jgi:putative ABC transport system permease protein